MNGSEKGNRSESDSFMEGRPFAVLIDKLMLATYLLKRQQQSVANAINHRAGRVAQIQHVPKAVCQMGTFSNLQQ